MVEVESEELGGTYRREGLRRNVVLCRPRESPEEQKNQNCEPEEKEKAGS